MAPLLLRGGAALPQGSAAIRLPRHRLPEDGSAARGIMVALALSSLLWVCVALLVPRLW